MSIEGGSRNNEIQDQEINRSANEQAERNQAETQRSGDKLEANSTIDNEGERKQIDSKEDGAGNGRSNGSSLDKKDSIDNEQGKDLPSEGEMQGHMALQGAEANTGGQESSLENNSEIADDPEDGLESESEIEQSSQSETPSLDDKNAIEDETKSPAEENNEGSPTNEKQDSLDNKSDISDGTETADATTNTEEGGKAETEPSLDDKNRIQDDKSESDPEKQPETPEQDITAENDGKQMENSEGTTAPVSEQKNEPQEVENTSDANQKPNEGEPPVSESDEQKSQKESQDVTVDENDEPHTSDANNQEGLNKKENIETDPNESSREENTGEPHEGTGTKGEVSAQDGEQKKPDSTESGTEENPEADVAPTQDVNETGDSNTSGEQPEEAKPTETESENPGNDGDAHEQKGETTEANSEQSSEQKPDTGETTSGEPSDGNGRVYGKGRDIISTEKDTPENNEALGSGKQVEANKSPEESNVKSDAKKEMTPQEIQERNKEYYAACNEIGKNETLTPQQKVEGMQDVYKDLGDGNRGDLQCVASDKYLDADKPFREDGRANVKYPEHQGFNMEEGKGPEPISRENPMQESVDRYGAPGGNFVAGMENGEGASYESRALPNIENPESYHKYDVNNEHYCDAIDIVKNCDNENIDDSVNKMNDMIDTINKETGSEIEHIDSDDMKDMVAHYNDYKSNLERDIPGITSEQAPYGLTGEAAPWINQHGEKLSDGGADQKWLPLTVSDFENIGIFKERK